MHSRVNLDHRRTRVYGIGQARGAFRLILCKVENLDMKVVELAAKAGVNIAAAVFHFAALVHPVEVLLPRNGTCPRVLPSLLFRPPR